MIELMAWVIAIPLAGGCIAFLVGRRAARIAGIGSACLTLLAATGLAWMVWDSGSARYEIGGWGVPLGINLSIDGLSAAMLLMTAGTGVVISFYALDYFPISAATDRGWSPHSGFWPLWLFLWGAMNALYLSSDAFNLYITFELLSIAGVALVILAGEDTALRAGIRYLLASTLGSIILLLGVALLYASFDTLDIAQLSERMTAGRTAWSAATLVTVGLLLKSALFPLHFWLPRAHASAPTPVSAILSALVVKASFYVMLRYWFAVFPPILTNTAFQFIGVLGAIAIIWGSVQAIRQHSLKLLIAYSTVAQVGYLFLLVPLAGGGQWQGTLGAEDWRIDAWSGGIYLAVSDAFAKGTMFLAAGIIMQAIGSDRLINLTAIAAHLRATTFAFGLAGISLIGLPPSGGFVGKWLMLNASIASGQWWWAIVILVGGVLTAGYVFLVLGIAMERSTSPRPFRLSPIPRRMTYATVLLATISFFLGIRAAEPLQFVGQGNPFSP